MLKAEEGNFDEVRRILTETKGQEVNSANKNGYTALALAVKGGYYQISGLLISSGADVNIPNNVIISNFHIQSLSLVKPPYSWPAGKITRT
jgi:ankyrin repeat protein